MKMNPRRKLVVRWLVATVALVLIIYLALPLILYSTIYVGEEEATVAIIFGQGRKLPAKEIPRKQAPRVGENIEDIEQLFPGDYFVQYSLNTYLNGKHVIIVGYMNGKVVSKDMRWFGPFGF